MNYGDKIRELREENNFTQRKIAEFLDIDNSLYNRYEKENQIIPIKHLIAICNFYNVGLDYIFNFTNNNEKNYNQEIDAKLMGKRLKEFRKDKKITQEKLAIYLNTTQSVIAGYEAGRYLIATPFLYMICKKYNISADYLLGRIN